MRERDCFLEKRRGRRRSEGRRGRGSLQGCPTTRPGRAQRARNARGDRPRKQPSSRSGKKQPKRHPQNTALGRASRLSHRVAGDPIPAELKARLWTARDLARQRTPIGRALPLCRFQTSNRPAGASDQRGKRKRSAAVSSAVARVVGPKRQRRRFGSEARSLDRAANSKPACWFAARTQPQGAPSYFSFSTSVSQL